MCTVAVCLGQSYTERAGESSWKRFVRSPSWNWETKTLLHYFFTATVLSKYVGVHACISCVLTDIRWQIIPGEWSCEYQLEAFTLTLIHLLLKLKPKYWQLSNSITFHLSTENKQLRLFCVYFGRSKLVFFTWAWICPPASDYKAKRKIVCSEISMRW